MKNQARFIGYGGMLTESFVAIMAMIGATVLEPGVYFAMNSPAGLIGKAASEAAQVVSGWGFSLTPEMITQLAQDVGEKTLLSRTGGAPTLAVGMASILSGMFGGRTLMGIWYHFAIQQSATRSTFARDRPNLARARAWLVIAAVCIYAIAYRFYARFVADKVLGVDSTRLTPAHRLNDGLDYVPTSRYVLFGHHFAASRRSGAGGANGIPTGNAMDSGWRGLRWRGSGLHGPVSVNRRDGLLWCAQKWGRGPAASRCSVYC
jgi:carbon starvation protein CstA